MSDNVTVDNGTGTDYPVATDDVGGNHYQRVKLDVGGDGASTPVVGSVPTSGDVANDAPDSGNPVKIGGKGVNNPAGVADGDRVDAWFDTSGAMVVSLEDLATGGQGGPYFAVSTADAQTASQFDGLVTASFGRVFNGSTWDRLRGDTLGLHISRASQAATATLTNVNDTASSTTLLAANTARKGASIHNDSTVILYVKFGTTASATSFTVKMAADAHYEVPFGYTGRIDGIWASDASGAARITELT